ncbi:FAD-binding oxidoreductase [Shimia biformata]|uniref:NAD(P)/FAD-dependent oxidoreductase n=1 Tax=Shimia biformata TaxID=1294299 RepID=UPI003083FD92
MLDCDLNVDLAIVGGGFTGTSAALEAARAGASVALLEAHAIGHGGSGRNVGLVNAGLWLPPDQVEAQMGVAPGRRLNDILAAAPEVVFGLIADHGIACDPVRNGTLHLAHSSKGLKSLKNRLAQQQARQAPVTLLDARETARRVGSGAFHGALWDRRAGTINPLAYNRGLARAARDAGAGLYENTPVTRISHQNGGWQLTAVNHTVRAQSLLVATNAYHEDMPGFRTPRAPKVSYFQMALRPDTACDEILSSILPGGEGCWDTGLIMTSVRRDSQGRILFGAIGRPNGAGRRIHLNWARRAFDRIFPQLASAALDGFWSGEISMPADHIPKIINFGPQAVAVMGYSGRGIAPGTVFGQRCARMLVSGQQDELPVDTAQSYAEAAVRAKSAFYEFGARLIHFGAYR